MSQPRNANAMRLCTCKSRIDHPAKHLHRGGIGRIDRLRTIRSAAVVPARMNSSGAMLRHHHDCGFTVRSGFRLDNTLRRKNGTSCHEMVRYRVLVDGVVAIFRDVVQFVGFRGKCVRVRKFRCCVRNVREDKEGMVGSSLS